MRAFIQPRNQIKPQLGTPLFGNSNLVRGLQLAVLLNERGGGGPLIGGTGTTLKIYDIRRHRVGTGLGIVGPSPPQKNWTFTHRGWTFINNSQGSGGAIDFGLISSYPAFTSISALILAGFISGLSVESEALIAFDGSSATAFSISALSNGNWRVQVNTSGGSINAQFLPSHASDANYMDTVAFTYDGTTLRSYLNGIAKTTASSNALSFATGSRVQLTGSSLISNLNHFKPISVMYLWNRVLSAREMQQLHVDPYWSLAAKTNSHRNVTAPPVVMTGPGAFMSVS